MSKVYIVEAWDGYDCSTERTVYSSKELAESAAAIQRRWNGEHHISFASVDVEEYELDPPQTLEASV